MSGSAPRRRTALIGSVALAVALAAALVLTAAKAAEPPAGSRNFTPPGYVPNYFSNESGPFRGEAPGPPAAYAPGPAPGPAPVAALAPPRRVVTSRYIARRHAMVRYRGHLVPARSAQMRRVAVRHAAAAASHRRAAATHRAAPAKARGIRNQRVARARG
jgi:hypothetical protein